MTKSEIRALIITPFNFIGREVAEKIRHGLHKAGISSLIPEDDHIESSFSGRIIEAITSVDLVVVDLTTYSPNVFYELGFAHGLRKPTILITSNETASNVPSDLEGFLYLAYDPNRLDSLVEQVRRAALAYVNQKKD